MALTYLYDADNQPIYAAHVGTMMTANSSKGCQFGSYREHVQTASTSEKLDLKEFNVVTGGAKISDVYITHELNTRPPGKSDTLREKIALQELANLMANDPERVLPAFVSLAMEMTEGISAGLASMKNIQHRAFFVGIIYRVNSPSLPAQSLPGTIALVASCLI